MKRTMATTAATAAAAAIIAMVAVLLTGCTQAGTGGGGAGGGPQADISAVDISRADGYARVWNSPAKLVRIDKGTPREVEWTDESGATVTVPISDARMLGSEHMLLSYEHNEERHVQMARRSDGELVDVPAPDNWERVRRALSHAYYVSDGRITRVDPDTGEADVLSGDDAVPGRAHLFVEDSGTPFALEQNFKKSYPAGGDNPRDLSGDSDALFLYDGIAAADSDGLRDRHTHHRVG